MSSSTSQTISPSDLRASLDLLEIKPGVRFSKAVLQDLLPDTETALFFGKVYELNASQLGVLLRTVLNTDVAEALFGEGGTHSNDLQGYLIGGYDEDGNWYDGIIEPARRGDVTFDPDVPTGEILPQVWESLEVEVAASIKAVAEKLESVVGLLPGKQGAMMFSSMMKLNAKRPTLGDYKAHIHHAPQKQNLLILDVSGSMTRQTVERIIHDVIALSYTANAHMAVVSNTTTHWEPGQYDVDAVLAASEFGGTHYETLIDLLSLDWGTVITIADYDSSQSAKQAVASKAKGSIDTVLDISLVARPTFLAECVGQLASEVKPLLIANSDYVLRD